MIQTYPDLVRLPDYVLENFDIKKGYIRLPDTAFVMTKLN